MEAFQQLDTLVEVSEANNKYGSENPSVRFHCFALSASVYASCPSTFLRETIHESIIPTLVQGIQVNSVEVAAHAFTALGRIVALMESTKKQELARRITKPELANSAIPYRRIMMAAGVFMQIRRILIEPNPKKSPDGLKSMALRFLTNFFCHPPSLHKDILLSEVIPLFQKVIQDGSPELANAAASFVETLCDSGYFEAIMDSDVIETCMHRLGKRIPLMETILDEDGNSTQKPILDSNGEVQLQPDFSLTEVFQLVQKSGDALASNAAQTYEQEQLQKEHPDLVQEVEQEAAQFLRAGHHGPGDDGEFYEASLDSIDNPNVHDADIAHEDEHMAKNAKKNLASR